MADLITSALITQFIKERTLVKTTIAPDDPEPVKFTFPDFVQWLHAVKYADIEKKLDDTLKKLGDINTTLSNKLP